MKMDWLRLWHELPTDPKWRVVSRRSGRPLPEIISIYILMLVNASQSEERGTLEHWDDEVAAAALDMETEQVLSIREAMQGVVLENNYLTGWERRQPEREREDNSNERVRRWRERKGSDVTQGNNENEPVTPCNATECNVTPCNAADCNVTPCNAPDKIREDKKRKDPNHIKGGLLKKQEHEQEQDRPITLIDQQYIPLFRQIASVFHEEDLPPTFKRINTLKKAMKLNHIGGFDRILEAASNLASSLSPPGMKRYDWLLHGFDFEEHITEFLTRKNNGKPKPRKYAAVPDDWRPEDAVVATTQ